MTTITIKTPSGDLRGLLEQVLEQGDWSLQTKTRLRDTIAILKQPSALAGSFSLPSAQDLSYLIELIRLVLANGEWDDDIRMRLRSILLQLREQRAS